MSDRWQYLIVLGLCLAITAPLEFFGPGVYRQARRLLSAVGWREPTPEDEVPNWTYRLPWPATTAEYDHLTVAAVTALRDVQEIAGPTDLVYRSWELTGRRRAVRLPGVEPDEGYAPSDGGTTT